MLTPTLSLYDSVVLRGNNPSGRESRTEIASARLRQWDRSYDKQYSPTSQQFAEGGPRSDRTEFIYVILNKKEFVAQNLDVDGAGVELVASTEAPPSR